jgi:hypothetical protein
MIVESRYPLWISAISEVGRQRHHLEARIGPLASKQIEQEVTEETEMGIYKAATGRKWRQVT